MGLSRSVTWLPRRRCWPCRCWPARQAKPSTTPPSSSSSSTPSRRRRPWRRRRGGGRWRKRSHGFAPRSMPVSLSLLPSMRPGTGPPLRPLGRGGRRKRGRGGSSRRLLFLVVDVPALISDKFQQSKLYDVLEGAPASSSSTKWWTFLRMRAETCTHSAILCRRLSRFLQVLFLDSASA